MKNITYLMLFFCFVMKAQIQQKDPFYTEIPASHLAHPELTTSHNKSLTQESKYELIHLRTQYAKVFLNTNQTKTTIQSAKPLHYKDANDYWITLDYKISEKNNLLQFPAQLPIVKYDQTTQHLSLNNGTNEIRFHKNVDFIFKNDQNQTIKKIKNNTTQPKINSENTLVFENYINQVNKQYTFFNEAIKSDYLLKNKTILPEAFQYLIIEETIEIPAGFTISETQNETEKTVHFSVVNLVGEAVFSFYQPIISDSKKIEAKLKHEHQPEFGFYKIVQVSERLYTVQTYVNAAYLLSNERVFPIAIDPVIILASNNNVVSCFAPNYQQSQMQVAIPAGETVLFSEISYDFVATQSSDAWMSEQRSFISGSNGQTIVYSGNGNQSGTFSYNIPNTEIANGVSTGNVNFVFNFARTWGGFGCNATFQFANNRQVSVTYGTIEFGNGPVYINEYSASNRSLNDSFGRTEDWIEIYNANEDFYFDLTGYYLSNDIDEPTKWQFENGIIPPNSRVLVYCSDRNISSGTVFHANFGLTQLRPDQIVFSNPEAALISSHEMFVTQTNHSCGRATDASENWQVFSNPTPGGANTAGFTGYASTPTFNLPPGKYQNSVSIALASAHENEEIRYTTNGATPTINATLYTGPLNIAATTVVRARAFSVNNNTLPGFIETNTYFINENSTLPVFSFAGDANLQALFNGNEDLEPLAHFEYFENNGDFIDENIGDFDKHGNDSWSYPQRGVDFVSRDDHGYKRRLEHSFFNTTNRDEFRRLMVKAGASDNYPFENGGAHVRDQFIQTLSQVSGLDLDERSANNVSVFVNGSYWGIYDLRERVDDNNYTDHYYGQDYLYRDSNIYVQFLKTWGATEAHFGNQPAIDNWQTLRQYVADHDMGETAFFNTVDNQLNINSLIDYFVLNSFVVSRDWLNYNTGWWRGLDPNGEAEKWRYILWDMDAALGHYTNFTGMPNVSATASPCQVENLSVGNGHTQILKKLIDENPSVRQKYVTRYADLLNTHFSEIRVTQVFDSIVGIIAPEMPRQIQRWGGNINTWQNNVQVARNFLTTRANHLMQNGLADCYNLTGPFSTTFNVFPANAGKVKMNSEWLPNYPFQAQVFGNIETLLKSEANAGYVFSHWEVDGAVVQSDAQNINIVLQLSQATQVIAHFIDPTQSDDALIYYWHFNTLETPQDVTAITADYKLITTAEPVLTYTGSGPRDIDVNNTGSELNLHQDQLAGSNARVRNPSENRSLIFDLPTNGYEEIKFTYAVERTNQGQLKNLVSYTLDGTNYTQTGLPITEFNVQTTFSLVQLDFTNIEGANNNPNFKIQINFDGNNTADNGNNRFDNITLKGIPIALSTPAVELAKMQIFPNPFEHTLQIISNENLASVTVYDMLGKEIMHVKDIHQNQTILDLQSLLKGVYILKINSLSGTQIHKVIKQ
jgi:hypothetical protein